MVTFFGPLFLAIVLGALFFCAVQAFVQLIRINLDRTTPNVDNEGEIEEFLAIRLDRDLSKPGSLSPLLIDG
jgi:hypothetical protein